MTAQEHGYVHSASFDSGTLPVGTIHKLHYEQYGKPDGKPVLFLHGGPGGSTIPSSTVFFTPLHYRIILHDQRGAGKSTPSGDLRENTSAHLVADIETLRRHLGIEKWFLVFGGSWGSALALMYAQAHPGLVGRLVLRGVHTCRREEYAWSRGANGAGRVWPDGYERFLSPLQPHEREDPIRAYHDLLTSEAVSEEEKVAATREWNRWDLTLSSIKPSYEKLEDAEWCRQHARIESWYFSHGCWVEDGELLREERIERIRRIPATIVQGRYDIITPPKTAWDLKRVWPEARLFWVDGAGHSVKDPGVQTKLAEVCDEYAVEEG
ncbi:hypothetical protein M409DRAFT_35925 [Zasmidium cellare ATCC 36951]|uniref:Proline iminopeptidase n=1 Tax=Zasmidium cellare ATCC 36951 TaxID=1080233 RepID=A0A6A6CVZ6_ZASCE|nr:uncharacterized protein M409DRAFT_35925 [Zasmidium cellare ATCC 36951]KAF2170370.1 hypothetical protein M409DRAFT_35925 [Zasmidium cellare ATCC 36951]